MSVAKNLVVNCGSLAPDEEPPFSYDLTSEKRTKQVKV